MPSFPASDPGVIADYLIPVTPEQAEQIAKYAREHHTCYAAVYGPDRDGKRIALALYVTYETTRAGANWYHVGWDDYHPRKAGKAELVFK